MSTHELPIEGRLRSWDDLSKSKVRSYYESQGCIVEDFGFNRSLLGNTGNLHIRLREAPDYIVKDKAGRCRFVEVKGCKGVLRFKLETLIACYLWEQLLPVQVAVYDSASDRIYVWNLSDFMKFMADNFAKLEQYWDNGVFYFAVPMPSTEQKKVTELAEMV